MNALADVVMIPFYVLIVLNAVATRVLRTRNGSSVVPRRVTRTGLARWVLLVLQDHHRARKGCVAMAMLVKIVVLEIVVVLEIIVVLEHPQGNVCNMLVEVVRVSRWS